MEFSPQERSVCTRGGTMLDRSASVNRLKSTAGRVRNASASAMDTMSATVTCAADIVAGSGSKAAEAAGMVRSASATAMDSVSAKVNGAKAAPSGEPASPDAKLARASSASPARKSPESKDLRSDKDQEEVLATLWNVCGCIPILAPAATKDTESKQKLQQEAEERKYREWAIKQAMGAEGGLTAARKSLLVPEPARAALRG